MHKKLIRILSIFLVTVGIFNSNTFSTQASFDSPIDYSFEDYNASCLEGENSQYQDSLTSDLDYQIIEGINRSTGYESEANNTMSTANRIYNDDTTYGKISYSGDVDYFKIMFTYSGKANFWVGNIPSGKDYDLYLYDSSGSFLASSTSNNSTSNQELIKHYTVTANTWYYIRVVGYNSYDSNAYYTLRAKCYSIKNIRILYDSSCSLTVQQITDDFNLATASFASEFGIEFSLQTVSLSTSLNGSSCPNTNIYSVCSTTCGAPSTCATTHHKSATRLLHVNEIGTTYTYRLVGHRLCYYYTNSSTHGGVTGLGEVSGLNSITSTYTSADLARSIQHELTHNLGGSHENCTSQDCVLRNDYMNSWCDNCRIQIYNHR